MCERKRRHFIYLKTTPCYSLLFSLRYTFETETFHNKWRKYPGRLLRAPYTVVNDLKRS